MTMNLFTFGCSESSDFAVSRKRKWSTDWLTVSVRTSLFTRDHAWVASLTKQQRDAERGGSPVV